MKKVENIFLCILLLISSQFASALDFGGSVDNITELEKQPDSQYVQQDEITLWLDSALGDNLQFLSSGSVFLENDTPHVYADVKQFVLVGSFSQISNGPSLFKFELGRYSYVDFTHLVLAQPLDGLQFDFIYPFIKLETSLGYTGLINKLYADPILGKEDDKNDKDNGTTFANPKFIGSFKLELPEIIYRQTPVFAAIIQTDLRPSFTSVISEGEKTEQLPDQGGRIDTEYFGIGLSGPLYEGFYYDLYGYLGTGRSLSYEADTTSTTGYSYQYEPILAYLYGGSLRYYLTDFFQSLFEVKFLYASGDKDQSTYYEGNTSGNSTQFLPMNGEPISLVFDPAASNICMTELAYSLKPFSKGHNILKTLQAGINGFLFYKPSKGAMSVDSIDSQKNAGFVGSEVDLGAKYRPFSDFGISLDLGVFSPCKTAFVSTPDYWYLCRCYFSLSY